MTTTAKTTIKRIASATLAVILAITLTPLTSIAPAAVAHAATLSATNVTTQSVTAKVATSVATQAKKKAKKKTVWVVEKKTKTTTTSSGKHYKAIQKCSYKKGLLVRLQNPYLNYTDPDDKSYLDANTYSYNKNGVLKKVGTMKYTIKNGKWTLGVSAGANGTKSEYHYTYKKGNVTNVTKKTYYTTGWSDSRSTTYTRNKKGLCTKITSTDEYDGITKYKYDSHGNLAKIDYTGGAYVSSISTYKNTYKNGRVTKMVKTRVEPYAYPASNSVSRYVISYKKLSVDSSLYKTIAAQQWALVNGNTNFALG